MSHCDGVGGHEACTAHETAVDKGAAILLFPADDEVGVLLVMHLTEIPKEKRGRGRAAEVAQRREGLPQQQEQERGQHIQRQRGTDEKTCEQEFIQHSRDGGGREGGTEPYDTYKSRGPGEVALQRQTFSWAVGLILGCLF